jgi:hypothetical protein
MVDRASASPVLQTRLFSVDEPATWPRWLAIPLTLFVWLIPAAAGLAATAITGSWLGPLGAMTLWVPWTWAAPKLVRFMLFGVEDWELPRRRLSGTRGECRSQPRDN